MTDQQLGEYLVKAKAWNWKAWPDEHNCWQTNAKRKRGCSQTYSGPSKRTLAKRAAKARKES